MTGHALDKSNYDNGFMISMVILCSYRFPFDCHPFANIQNRYCCYSELRLISLSFMISSCPHRLYFKFLRVIHKRFQFRLDTRIILILTGRILNWAKFEPRTQHIYFKSKIKIVQHILVFTK